MDTEALATTRHHLHVVAEHLLAGDLSRRTGRIGLRVTPGGFGQPEVLADGHRRRLRVDGTRLVVLDGDDERWHPLDTAADAAARASTSLGAPVGTYEAETELDADAPLALDAEAAAAIAGWFALVGEALEVVRRSHADRTPTLVQLWPEHFDVACVIDEVNLGGSPGDGDHPEPYLYVGPWSPRRGAFWNEPWGASASWREIGDVDAAVAFLEAGLREAFAPAG